MSTAIQEKPIQLTLFDLEALEVKVRAGLKSFIEVGDALTKIRDGDGWKLRGFDSFDEYVEKTFGFSVRHGQRLIAAAETARQVERLTGETPASESVAREIKRVVFSPAAVKQVQAELKQTGKSIATAKAEVIARVITGVLQRTTAGAPAKSPAARKPAPAQTYSPVGKPAAPYIPEPAIPDMTVLPGSEFCPSCGLIPDAYTRDGKVWRCDECGGAVLISVSSEVVNG